VKYLHKGHKININFVRLILQYPHLKHKMLVGFLDGLCNIEMLGIQNAWSMKKMMMIKNLKIRKKIKQENKNKNLEGKKVKEIRKIKHLKKKDIEK